MSETSAETGDFGLEEGECGRCGKLVTRKPGGRWHDQFGRDRCKADPEDGQCQPAETWPYQHDYDNPPPVKPPPRPLLVRGYGHATHNRAAEPGKLEITVWGLQKRTWKPQREVGIVLDEAAIAQLVSALERFDLLRRHP